MQNSQENIDFQGTPWAERSFSYPNRIIRLATSFSGIGAIEYAFKRLRLHFQIIFAGDIDPNCKKTYFANYNISEEQWHTDIHNFNAKPYRGKVDLFVGGAPCQAFSIVGEQRGFNDTRGTLFFEVERILKDKRPKGFILENVEGLVNHDGGKTLQVIIDRLTDLNYKFDFRVLNSKYFGVPQERKRIYIIGSIYSKPNLDNFSINECKLGDILESGLPTSDTPFIRTLLKHFSIEQLYGKSIKDKRGGETNIHSWDLEIKGPVSDKQKKLLDMILTERRKKKWAGIIGIDWMDGMPLTLDQIRTFFDDAELKDMLEDLTEKGYLKFEHPKKLIREKNSNGVAMTRREYDTTKPKGYNIVAGKLSFEINKVMSPDDISPTLVAMDMQKLYVGDKGGLRRLTLREGLRLCGYPDEMKFNVSEKDGFDLLGNTVVVPVIKAVAERLLDALKI